MLWKMNAQHSSQPSVLSGEHMENIHMRHCVMISTEICDKLV
jgi:hypothetical protein